MPVTTRSPAIGGRYANWTGGEPNDDGTEDCAELKPGGEGNDIGCGERRAEAG